MLARSALAPSEGQQALSQCARRRRQSGAALIAVLTVLVLVSAAVLLNRINHAPSGRLSAELTSSAALAQAKAALIAYAITYPDLQPGDGPGFLPCPDTDDDGLPNAPCDTLTVGRLPVGVLGAGELLDGAGERLWYAVSDNFRDEPKIAALNSETPGQLSLDGRGDIAALVLAPGEPLAAQGARHSAPNDISNFLEDDNASGGDQSFVTRAAGEFNDRVRAIPRSELMRAVEKRVLGEVSKALERYRSTYGAYPWLSAFADPRHAPLTGTAAAGSAGETLVEASVNFIALGVVVGDVVQNQTDGSRGIVSAVDATTVTVASLFNGADDSFAPGDAYRISRFNRTFDGALGATEGLLPFHDLDEGFRSDFIASWNLQEDNGVSVSAIGGSIAAYEASLRGLVESVVVSGAVPVAFEDGICVWTAETAVDCVGRFALTYLEGMATRASSAELEDRRRDFDDWGVTPGAIVESLEDGAWGIVDSVNDDTLLLHGGLSGGNSFAVGEGYRVRIPTRTTSTSSPLLITGGPENSETLWGTTDLDFAAMGVRAGDVVHNVDDPGPAEPEWGRIDSVGDPNPYNLLVPGMDFDPGERYSVKSHYVDQREYRFALEFDGSTTVYGAGGHKRRDVCSNATSSCSLSGVATSGSAGLTLQEDLAVNFLSLGVQVGDVVENLSDGSAGFVSSLGASTLGVASLHGGLANAFSPGDVYRVYLTEALTAATSGAASVIIVDRDADGDVVGSASATIPSAGSPTGAIQVTGLHVDLEVESPPGLDPGFDLPSWLIDNDWHRLVYVAAARQALPGGAGSCTQGVDCVTVNGTQPDDNKQLVVIATGAELDGQDRASGTACGALEPPFFCDYFEGENADLELDEATPPTFDHGPATSAFNDQVRVAAIVP